MLAADSSDVFLRQKQKQKHFFFKARCQVLSERSFLFILNKF